MHPGQSPPLSQNLSFTGRIGPLILLIAWVAMQGVLLFSYGIVTTNEAEKYIEQADLLINTGSVSHPSLWLYSTQIFLIAAAKQVHAGFIAVVVVQLLFNALATYYLYRLCLELSNSTTAFVCVLLFILNWPFQAFNTHLYTESLYYSFMVLLSCYLLRLRELKFRNFTWIILFLIVICFTRPGGLLLVPCTFLYLLFRFFRSMPVIIKLAVILGITILFVFILNLALGSGGELDFMLPFREEHIICGVPTITASGTTAASDNSIGGIFQYVLHHPAQFVRLAGKRTLAFFGLFRSYYSTGHNVYLWLYFFPVYLLVLFSLREWWQKNRSLLLYCLSVIAITWGTVILTCDDWHNRFFLSILPFIYILSLPALQKIITILTRNRQISS